jgi:precorrin-2/cobalt-factor-2 C20-methyltransferase
MAFWQTGIAEKGYIMTAGVLYGVGTGPGDPGLVTRRAWQLINDARTIAYLAPDTGDSFARSIVADAIAADAEEIVLRVPMRPGRAPAQHIYDDGAARIAKHLAAGRDVVMLCEGDPLFYGSFMYILARLKEEFRVEVVPGVTSLTACAASHLHPLVARNDVMTILPATLDDAVLRARIGDAEAVAIMKLGRHMPRLRALLAAMGLADRTLYVSHASLETQFSCSLADAPDAAPYFSMLLLYKGDDPWIKT